MDRRELLGVLGATAAGLAAVSGTVAYGQEKKEGQKKGQQGHEAMAEKTGKTYSDCANDCNKGFHHCRGRQEGVRRGGPRVRPLEHGRSAHPFSSTHCVV